MIKLLCFIVQDKCGNCFINPNLDRKKVQCPNCDGLMCFQCKKPVSWLASVEWSRAVIPLLAVVEGPAHWTDV